MKPTDSDSWRTPAWLTNALGRFDLDPCSGPGSTVLSTLIYSLELGSDGLAMDWDWHSVFVNPPFSNPLPWAEKLAEHRGPWAALVKLDPTTQWWRTLVGDAWQPNVQWTPFRRRIRFSLPSGEPGPHVANFPCALVWAAWEPPTALREHLWL